MQISAIKDKVFWLLTIFAAIYIVGNIGTGSLTTYDEATIANISREILNRSDWIVLYHGGGPWIDKPPLYMWCTAIWYSLFGVSEFAVRATSGIFGVIAFALGYLTKGFAAVTALIIISAYCIFTNNVRILFRRQFVIGMLIAVILIGGWHLSQYMALGQKAIDTFFGTGVYKRATSTLDGHSGGMNFYQKVIFNKNKPWAVLLYASSAYMVWLALRKRDRRAILLCAWAAVMYTLYTVVRSKLHWYIMPAYPALAISSGIFLDRFLKNKAFKVSVAVILLGMLIQVPVSWAFKLDFCPEIKAVSKYARSLHDQGAVIYLYKGYDDKETFYLGTFSSPLTDSAIPSREALLNSSVYCLMRMSDIDDASKQYKIIFKPEWQSGNTVLARMKAQY
ncbi:MAG: glycosyltransferase family 39 protein [Candidatus Omnitrophica bacterium]|nr:glycosyltransferase family 39 protein [Candidatus Omnitrophota bacterium]